jgi:hypothetical protein
LIVNGIQIGVCSPVENRNFVREWGNLEKNQKSFYVVLVDEKSDIVLIPRLCVRSRFALRAFFFFSRRPLASYGTLPNKFIPNL